MVDSQSVAQIVLDVLVDVSDVLVVLLTADLKDGSRSAKKSRYIQKYPNGGIEKKPSEKKR